VAKDSAFYSIHEVAERLGIAVPKLRRWHERGVLVAHRTEGGHRRYPRDLIDQLAATGAPSDRTSEEIETIKYALADNRRVLQMLLESEHRYRDLVETSHDVIWSTDAQGRFTYLNSAASELFGVPPRELYGRCFFDYEGRNAHVANRRFLSQLRRKGEIKDYVTHLVTARGATRWVEINAREIYDGARRRVGVRGSARDVTEQHEARRRIEYLALHDTLTELRNRTALQQALEPRLAGGMPGAVMFLDLDHFKDVNDQFGHRAGDQLIVGVGSALREALRELESAELYRLGGDEFAVHLPGALRQDAVAVAGHLVDAVRHYQVVMPGKRNLSSLSVSVGIALYPFHGRDTATLFANADLAMYEAKDCGRNRHVLFDHGAQELRASRKRAHWAKKLRDVLDDDRLVLYAQPVVRLADGRPAHHEILARIEDDQGQLVRPGMFIEAAESLGMAPELDFRVLEKLLRHMRLHDEQGLKLRYFVNLSRASISNEQWVRRVLRLLAGSPVTPNQLVFEITETAAMAQVDTTLSFIREVKELGCRLALDDFGAGFSSFYYLKRFDVDYLKIDGNFVRDLATDPSSRVFVQALLYVAQGLRKQVIAEWVESAAVADLLRDMGAQFGQGFLFREPLPLSGELHGLPPAAAAPVPQELVCRMPGRRRGGPADG
jgi:diguanylate cyclase (GGDEF)-like protein/PAS domain S-box-containing protein/excisionase family DNA binding protein